MNVYILLNYYNRELLKIIYYQRSVKIFPILVLFCKNTLLFMSSEKSYLYTNQIKYYIMKSYKKMNLKRLMEEWLQNAVLTVIL